ncbi:serine hydrolase domain-containing protein [Aquimarina sp. 2201CG1-2-11]|uniref:serine hydrolase domain-containing protein n=1 Tax=Aquimarina discodermiae TaxID=3231043 RepID=UPI00346181A6
MTIFLILLGVILFISLVIWGIWIYENSLPKLAINAIDNEEQTINDISDWLQYLSDKQKFNGAILYSKNGTIKLANAYGYTSSKKDEKLTTQSVFRLASVSKQFTAFGIMVLKKKYQVDYDDLATKYIADFGYPQVTIRHLLNHTSGIKVDYIKLAKRKKRNKEYILSNKDAVDLLCSNINSNTNAPLHQYFYNNSNYIVLARIIEVVTNMSFEEYMQEYVFIPLQLKQTRVWNLCSKHSRDPDTITMGFEAFLKSNPVTIEPNWIDGVAGDGGIFSSIQDLVAWDKIWYNNPILTPLEMQEAFTLPQLNTQNPSNYGFGWVIDGDNVWHNGQWLAYNAFILRNTRQKTCFVLLDNSSNTRFDKVLNTILPNIIPIKNNAIP